jgi:16S rRNA (adenine1518-N6/adenine1519-N6)-dimethyltransferase
MPAQTKAHLQALFRSKGAHPKRRLGQNFILDPNLLDFIVRTAGPGPGDTVLEVGTGTGQLTTRLAARSGRVVSIEVDAILHAEASRTLAEYANVVLLKGDALATKSRIDPVLQSALAADLPAPESGRLMLVSNLAYSIATPLILNLLETDLPFATMVVTVQKELAEKLSARRPGDPGYGPVSVLTAFHASAQIVRTVPPRVFWPAPAVDSAIVKILPENPGPEREALYPRFRERVRGLFTLRRKMLHRSLEALGFAEKGEGRAMLESAGIEPEARPDALTPEDFLRLANLKLET